MVSVWKRWSISSIQNLSPNLWAAGSSPENFGSWDHFPYRKQYKPLFQWTVTGWWLSPTPLKNMSSSVGIMTFPIYGKIKNDRNHQPGEVVMKFTNPLGWNHSGRQMEYDSLGLVLFTTDVVRLAVPEKNQGMVNAPWNYGISNWVINSWNGFHYEIKLRSFKPPNWFGHLKLKLTKPIHPSIHPAVVIDYT